MGFIAAGLALGVLTGLFPGLHLNTVASLILYAHLPGSLNMVLLIVAMNIMHSFMDFIPSILLGAPSEQNFLAVFPGHRLFLQGKALLAIHLTILGNLLGIIGSMVLIPVYTLFAEQTRFFLEKNIPLVLASVTLLMAGSEKTIPQKIMALVVVGLSGLTGIWALRQNNSLLFAMIAGFFGVSTLLYSLKDSPTAIEQKTEAFPTKPRHWLRAAISGSIFGSAVSLFPAISSAQAAFAAQSINQRFSSQQFLVLLGAINASSTVFSFVALQILGKARTGSAVTIQSLYSLSTNEFWMVMATVLFCAGIAGYSTAFLAARILSPIQKMNYKTMNALVIGILLALTVALNGLQGIPVLAAATGIGLLTHRFHIKKSHCMGCLVLPTILFYWRL